MHFPVLIAALTSQLVLEALTSPPFAHVHYPPVFHGPPRPVFHGPPRPAFHGPPRPMFHGPPRPVFHGPPPPVFHGPPPPAFHGPPRPVFHGPPRPPFQVPSRPPFQAPSRPGPPPPPTYSGSNNTWQVPNLSELIQNILQSVGNGTLKDLVISAQNATPVQNTTTNTQPLLPTPANSGASVRTKSVYDYLSQLGDAAILGGAFGGYSNAVGDTNFSLAHGNAIQVATSKFPAAYEMNCALGSEVTAPGREDTVIECMNQNAFNFSFQGGFLIVSHTLPNPVFEGNNATGNGQQGAARTRISNDQYEQILKDGTPERKRWLSSLDKVARGLEVYRDSDITVLYRPLHSMNSNTYWWGEAEAIAKDTLRMQLFKRLWVDLFDYFTNVKQLNNLIWVYSADDKSNFRTAYYPGSQYVDIVGLNMYTDDPNSLVGYGEMVLLNKPFALTEVGPLTLNGQYDYGKLVESIRSRYPKTIYFSAWFGDYSPIKNKGALEAYNSSAVLSLTDFMS